MAKEKIDQSAVFPSLEKQLKKKGCFLVVGDIKPNIMTIGWATAGIIWGKPILTVAVRLSRYSHEKLDELKEFTVCVPKDGTFEDELIVAGTRSGRDMDKSKELGIVFESSENISVPMIKGCEYAYECRVVYETEMHEAHLDKKIRERDYRNGDYHTLYFGEIVNCVRL